MWWRDNAKKHYQFDDDPLKNIQVTERTRLINFF